VDPFSSFILTFPPPFYSSLPPSTPSLNPLPSPILFPSLNPLPIPSIPSALLKHTYVFLPLPITHALTDTMSLKDSIRLGFVLVYSAERPASLAVIK